MIHLALQEMNTQKQKLLNQKIVSIPFSPEQKNILQTNGLEILEDLVNVEVYNWHKYPGFNYHHQQEIVNYLKQNQLLRYLKED